MRKTVVDDENDTDEYSENYSGGSRRRYDSKSDQPGRRREQIGNLPPVPKNTENWDDQDFLSKLREAVRSNGRKAEEMDILVKKNPDITLAEIKETLHLSIQKSEISNILRNKLGLRYKKRWYIPASISGLQA
ncbi:MAG: hypothetical protein LKJ21_02605 [Oscillospiraceae bacterium]|nr:hypothetical protein [Oscillospiraceae bacterium]MCI2035497.1 hypothetical protein [Oscillospiraceae bacterium]